jgi:hypothetical protein
MVLVLSPRTADDSVDSSWAAFGAEPCFDGGVIKSDSLDGIYGRADEQNAKIQELTINNDLKMNPANTQGILAFLGQFLQLIAKASASG